MNDSGHQERRPLVLIIDDNQDHVEFLRVALGTEYRVDTASNGFDGYVLACDTRPDVVLVDIMMPLIDGFTVVRKLRTNPQTATIAIVVVTALDAESLTNHPDGIEVAAVLRKPCHKGEILAAIKTALNTNS